jgi:hypothetical protein
MVVQKIDLDLVENMTFQGYDNPRYGVLTNDDIDDVFCDTADYDGEPMSEEMVDLLNDDYFDFVWENAYTQLCC